MKKTLLFLLFPLNMWAQHSGLFSMNRQETVNTTPKQIYLSTEGEWLDFIYDSKFPEGIVNLNNAKDPSFFEKHADEMGGDSYDYLQIQLSAVNEKYKVFTSDGAEVDMGTASSYIQYHVSIQYIKFNLKPGEKVYLLGEKGDFSGADFAAHDYADGYYYVLTTNSGLKFLLARVSCFNNVSKAETFWIEEGKAVIIDPDKSPEDQGDIDVNAGNGKQTLVIPAGASNITLNLTVNGGAGGNATATNGSVNANVSADNSGFDANPNYSGGGGSTVTTPNTTGLVYYTPSQQPMLVPNYQNTAVSYDYIDDRYAGSYGRPRRGGGGGWDLLNGNTFVFNGGSSSDQSCWDNPRPSRPQTNRPTTKNYSHSMGASTDYGVTTRPTNTGYSHSMGASTSYGVHH